MEELAMFVRVLTMIAVPATFLGFLAIAFIHSEELWAKIYLLISAVLVGPGIVALAIWAWLT